MADPPPPEIQQIASQVHELLAGNQPAQRRFRQVIDEYERLQADRKRDKEAWENRRRLATRENLFKGLTDEKASPPEKGWRYSRVLYRGEVPWSNGAEDYVLVATAAAEIAATSSERPDPADVEEMLRQRVEQDQIRYMKKGKSLRVNPADLHRGAGWTYVWLPPDLADEPTEPDEFGAVDHVLAPQASPLVYKYAWLAAIHDACLGAVALFVNDPSVGIEFHSLRLLASGLRYWTAEDIPTMRAFMLDVRADLAAHVALTATALSGSGSMQRGPDNIAAVLLNQAQAVEEVATALRRWGEQLKGKRREEDPERSRQATREVFAVLVRHAKLLRRLLGEYGCHECIRPKITNMLDLTADAEAGKDMGGWGGRAYDYAGEHLWGGPRSVPDELTKWASRLRAEAANASTAVAIGQRGVARAAENLNQAKPIGQPDEAPPAGKKPAHRPPTYDPVKDEKIMADWQATRAAPDRPTEAQFEKHHGLNRGGLELLKARIRSRKRRDKASTPK